MLNESALEQKNRHATKEDFFYIETDFVSRYLLKNPSFLVFLSTYEMNQSLSLILFKSYYSNYTFMFYELTIKNGVKKYVFASSKARRENFHLITASFFPVRINKGKHTQRMHRAEKMLS
jgi:hypothetical protein